MGNAAIGTTIDKHSDREVQMLMRAVLKLSVHIQYVIVEKVHSSSMNPITITTTTPASFRYSETEIARSAFMDNFLHVMDKEL